MEIIKITLYNDPFFRKECEFNLKGCVGLIGRNGSGKTFLIDMIIFTLFNKSLFKNIKKEQLFSKIEFNNEEFIINKFGIQSCNFDIKKLGTFEDFINFNLVYFEKPFKQEKCCLDFRKSFLNELYYCLEKTSEAKIKNLFVDSFNIFTSSFDKKRGELACFDVKKKVSSLFCGFEKHLGPDNFIEL